VAMFPETRLPRPHDSVLAGGRFNPSLIRLANLTRVPIIPTVILGTGAYRRTWSWMPLRSVRYAVNFGRPMRFAAEQDIRAGADALRRCWMDLHAELREHPGFANSQAAAVSDQIMRALN